MKLLSQEGYSVTVDAFAAVARPVRAAISMGASETSPGLTLRQLLDAGGVIGYIILVLSVVMVAFVVQHLLAARRSTLMPPGLTDKVHDALAAGRLAEAEAACQEQPSVLARMLSAGITEAGHGYASVEKALEDAAVEQSARLFRQVEYLATISTIAPMLGLLGTVWGMILAFMEFEQKANPQVSELAPGIYRALVTTLFGLLVAVPALATYAIFRNRIDERIAETALLAEKVFADFRTAKPSRKTRAAETAAETVSGAREGRGRALPKAAFGESSVSATNPAPGSAAGTGSGAGPSSAGGTGSATGGAISSVTRERRP